MTFSIYDASAPLFMRTLTNMQAWLDKAAAQGKDEATLMGAKLADDMRPLPFQFQAASDGARNAIARLTGGEVPSMPADETSFEDLKERCRKTIRYIGAIDPGAYAGASEREVELKFPNGMGYRFNGGDYLTGFVLPDFFFHVTTAYALLRANGVQVGKPDFLQHLGPPNITG